MAQMNYVSHQNLADFAAALKYWVDSNQTKAIKAVDLKNNAIDFYNDADFATSGAQPSFHIDLPTEYFLDQAKTTFVKEFTWSAETYPGSIDPSTETSSLEGKPVLVLALKGTDGKDTPLETVSYSFIPLTALVDIYTGGNTTTAKVTISSTNEITTDVQVSTDTGNLLEIHENGLYAASPEEELKKKADKLTGEAIKEDQVLIDDGTGNLKASGKTVRDIMDDVEAEFVEMTQQEIIDLF